MCFLTLTGVDGGVLCGVDVLFIRNINSLKGPVLCSAARGFCSPRQLIVVGPLWLALQGKTEKEAARHFWKPEYSKKPATVWK